MTLGAAVGAFSVTWRTYNHVALWRKCRHPSRFHFYSQEDTDGFWHTDQASYWVLLSIEGSRDILRPIAEISLPRVPSVYSFKTPARRQSILRASFPHLTREIFQKRMWLRYSWTWPVLEGLFPVFFYAQTSQFLIVTFTQYTQLPMVTHTNLPHSFYLLAECWCTLFMDI